MDFVSFRNRDESRVDDETEELARQVIGAAIEVHREFGPGLPESAYKKALSRELTLRQIPHQCEYPVPIVYKGTPVGDTFIDILVGGRLILELKAIESLGPVHRAQAVTYLKLTKLKLALLINFNVPVLREGLRRVVNTY